MSDLFSFDAGYYEQHEWIVGVDEVGRGPLAGPVTAAAFAMHRDWFLANKDLSALSKVNDSKQLKESDREDLFEYAADELKKESKGFDWVVAHASVEEIDEFNILEATKMAMKRSLSSLESSLKANGLVLDKVSDSGMFELEKLKSSFPNAKLLIDGKPLKNFPFTHKSIVKGDGKSFSIAMASIVAKVTRDRLMFGYAKKYPEYAWEKNKGYGTKAHREALATYGATPLHRKSFLTKLLVKEM